MKYFDSFMGVTAQLLDLQQQLVAATEQFELPLSDLVLHKSRAERKMLA